MMKLLKTALLSGALYAATFGTTFLALDTAMAQPAPAGSGVAPGGTTPPATTTPATGSGTAPVGADTPATGSGTAPVGAGEPPATGSGTAPVGAGEPPATGAGTAPVGVGEPPATGAGTAPVGTGEPPATGSATNAPVVEHQAGSGDTRTETGAPDVGGVHGTGSGTAAGAVHDTAHGAGKGGDGHGGGAHGGGHGDPSKHFNFFNFSYGGKDITGEPYGDGKMGGVEVEAEEAMSPPFILMVVNFALLLGLLAWKGGPIFRKLAEDRHDQIKNALEEAATLRKQAPDKLAELESKVKTADDEIKKLVDGMRADAEADKQRILENAERQAAQMKRDAELRIAAEVEYARAQLTKEVTAAATLATEKILREQMQPADQQKLVASFIADVQSQAGQKGARQ